MRHFIPLTPCRIRGRRPSQSLYGSSSHPVKPGAPSTVRRPRWVPPPGPRRPTDCIQSQLMPKNKGVVSSRQVATTLLQVLGLPLSQLDGRRNEVTPSLPLLFSVISSLKLNRLVDMGRSRRPRERNGLRSGSYLALSLETKSGFCTNLESCGSRGIAYLNLHYHNQYPRKI
jgi:hypothetical protein